MSGKTAKGIYESRSFPHLGLLCTAHTVARQASRLARSAGGHSLSCSNYGPGDVQGPASTIQFPCEHLRFPRVTIV
eukprot:2716185-Pyramimonas_sp.AAC.1